MSTTWLAIIGACVLVVVVLFRRALRLRMDWKNATEQIVQLRQDSASYAALKASLSTSATAHSTVVVNTGTVEGSLEMADERSPVMQSVSTDERGNLGAGSVRPRLDYGYELAKPVMVDRDED